MPQPKPVPSELIQAYLQAGELQFNIKVLESNLVAVNNRINEMRKELEVLERANKADAPLAEIPTPETAVETT